jgi:hypothetical protein
MRGAVDQLTAYCDPLEAGKVFFHRSPRIPTLG